MAYYRSHVMKVKQCINNSHTLFTVMLFGNSQCLSAVTIRNSTNVDVLYNVMIRVC